MGQQAKCKGQPTICRVKRLWPLQTEIKKKQPRVAYSRFLGKIRSKISQQHQEEREKIERWILGQCMFTLSRSPHLMEGSTSHKEWARPWGWVIERLQDLHKLMVPIRSCHHNHLELRELHHSQKLWQNPALLKDISRKAALVTCSQSPQKPYHSHLVPV